MTRGSGRAFGCRLGPAADVSSRFKNRQWTAREFRYNFGGPISQMSDDQTQASPRRGKSLRILVVEDHADTLRVLARLLDHFGHKISVADSTQSALQFLQLKDFDVVLSDIGLPDGSGYDVVSQAKQKQRLKAVALTAFNREEDVRRGKEAGFDFHLSKPIDFQELRGVLAQVGA
jgi:CheY-like chemotaxis protein